MGTVYQNGAHLSPDGSLSALLPLLRRVFGHIFLQDPGSRAHEPGTGTACIVIGRACLRCWGLRSRAVQQLPAEEGIMGLSELPGQLLDGGIQTGGGLAIESAVGPQPVLANLPPA